MRLKFILFNSFVFFLISSLFSQPNPSSKGEFLIDFSLLTQGSDSQTEIDFSDLSSLYGLPEEEKSKMKIDFSLSHWQLFIPPPLFSFFNKNPSYIAPAQVKKDSPVFADETILGMRLFFPLGKEETYILYPPFPIPFEEEEGTDKFMSRGLIRNVGSIKEVLIDVYSEYADVRISLNLEDSKGKTISIPFSSLNFWGWRSLIWINPYYYKNYNLLKSNSIPNFSHSGDYRLKSLSFTHSSFSKKSEALIFIKSIKIIYDEGEKETSLEEKNEIILNNYQDSLDKYNIPYYKRYIMENYLNKKKSSVLKNNDSFVSKENS